MIRFDIKKILENISYEPQLALLAQITKDEENGDFVDRRRFFINGNWYILVDAPRAKVVVGPDYNYIFIKKSGFFQRWGKTVDDDPLYSPIGPEILDIEISTDGCPNNCPFCYKGNTNKDPTNMSLETFKSIINKFPRVLTQVAFGITGIQTNPDFIPMMEYCREIGVVPNFTLSGIDLTDEIAEKVSKISGALAISAYQTDKNVCYNTVKKFTDLGMDQVNIHLMVSQETLDFVYEVLNDRLTDPRLKDMHAIVFLGVKPKGRAKNGYHSLTKEQYAELIKYCLDKSIAIGFDSCSSGKFENAVKGMDLTDDVKKQFIEASESCESSIFSSYINVHGEYWHCSFTENEPNQICVDVLKVNDFISEVWYSDTAIEFRNKLISGMIDGCRHCHVFPQINE
jgi:MoaA/NifB/PqqE/SkfB family radical SAM enzyme